MAIGNKVGSIKNLKKTLKAGGSGPFRFVPKGDGDKPGELTVRFLEEPDEWFNYNEHWDESLNKSYPCVGDDCPGCRTQERKASRYLANALEVEKDQVIAIQMPKDLTNKLLRKYERFGTIIDRDYILMREGAGLNTKYDADHEEPMKRRVAKYELKDLQVLLDQAFKDVFNDDDDDDDDDDDETPKRGSKSEVRPGAAKRKRPVPPAADEEEEEEEEEEPPRKTKPAAKKSAASPKAKKPEPEEEEEEDEEPEEEEPVYEEDSEEEEEEEEGEEDDSIEAPDDPSDLDEWGIPELKTLAEEYEVDLGKERKKSAIIATLVAAIYTE